MSVSGVATSDAHILLVDDEPAVRLFLAEELRSHGYRVTALGSGEEALAWLRHNQADVVVLDLKMGGMNGLQVMAALEGMPLPPAMIVLTAYGSLEAAVETMRHGGCDFLCKPCPPDRLLAAIERGLARRRKEQEREELLRLIEEAARKLQAMPGASLEDDPPPQILEGRGLLLDRQRGTVVCRGQPLSLSPSEFRLLACLMSHPNRPLSFRDMLRCTHGVDEPEAVARETLRTTLWRLRKKLPPADDGRPYIVNVRGRGYMFVK